jgi:hypothetical protein
MSAVPPSCFDWPKASGLPIYYGGATILSNDKMTGTRTYHPTTDIVQSGNGVQGQFQRLDERFLYNASGWGNIAGENWG